MPIPQKIIKFIGDKKHEILEHKTVFTAHDKAATLKVPEKTVGKTLVLKLDKELGLALIPANRNLDKNKLKKAARVKKVDFASETIMKNRLKGAKPGAVPPFGPVWKMPVFVDNSLLKAPKIVVNSGHHDFSFRISGPILRKLIPGLIGGSFGKARK
jgi:Ala-tRNA(Pro) deacylase